MFLQPEMTHYLVIAIFEEQQESTLHIMSPASEVIKRSPIGTSKQLMGNCYQVIFLWNALQD